MSEGRSGQKRHLVHGEIGKRRERARRDADTTADIQLGVRLFSQRDSCAERDHSIILALLAADELRAAVNAERSGNGEKHKDASRHAVAKWMPLITER